MHKTKILIGLATLVCSMAATATSANAWFASTNGATTGTIASFPASSTFTDTVGTAKATVNCVSSTNTKATGFWTIQTGTETVSGEEITQPAATEGPHEAITVQKWGTCSAEIGTEKLAAEVKECRLQIAQPTKGVNSGTGSVQTTCEVKIPAAICTIKVQQTKANVGLAAVTLATSGTGIAITSNVAGLTAKQSAGCVGVSGEHKEATFKTGVSANEAITTAGQKLV